MRAVQGVFRGRPRSLPHLRLQAEGVVGENSAPLRNKNLSERQGRKASLLCAADQTASSYYEEDL